MSLLNPASKTWRHWPLWPFLERFQLPLEPRRNADRFPQDFMFQLTEEEAAALRSQIVTLERGRGRYPKYAPLAFTEHGVGMLASVLHRDRAVQMSFLLSAPSSSCARC